MSLTKKRIATRFGRVKLDKVAKVVIAERKPGVQLMTTKRAPRSFSKIGGVPDLPKGMKWPSRECDRKSVPLAFLAQIDFGAASKKDKSGTLPKSGRAWFFYDTIGGPWGFDPADRDGWKVVFASDEIATKPVKIPTALKRTDAGGAFPERDVTFKSIETFPGLDALGIPKKEKLENWEQLWSAFDETVQRGQGQKDGSAFHWMLGHATVLQDTMELECQLVSNGLSIGGEDLTAAEKVKARALKAGAKDWVLLLQLDSDDSVWMWGDLGMLYFWIRKQDLAKGDFSKVWMILQCG